jgi:dihydrofolate synthase/folylpolyglutamate synthase
LLEKLGNPHFKFKAVHIAGTNGKGSSAHFIASILQSAGYKVGLYTSPHLKSFTERIKINGKEVSEDFVGEFVERVKPLLSKISPSFFEMTVAMAFDYFAQKKINIAVVEVGLGGRLDSTNVLIPEVSLITNISYDHTDLLGNTLEQIAFEKAGIIKNSRPVVIGKRQEEVAHIFRVKAKSESTRIYFASDEIKLKPLNGAYQIFRSGKIWIELMNVPIVTDYIIENLPGVLQTIILLRQRGFIITDEAIKEGIREMVFKTGLKGRWQKINDKPLAICDVAHNLDGILKVLKEIRKIRYNKLLVVW